MKVVLLAGGMGTRISEETGYRPKPMIEIGGMPILWHIMKEYSYYGLMNLLYVPDISSILSKNGLRIIFCILQISLLT